jgi:hypothetical protein
MSQRKKRRAELFYQVIDVMLMLIIIISDELKFPISSCRSIECLLRQIHECDMSDLLQIPISCTTI